MAQAVIPLESNPEIFTKFAKYLGLKSNLEFVDVYSLVDQDLLSFIPRPSPSIILLFPITKNYESFRKQEDSEYIRVDKDVLWFKQTIKNACGLYALLNSICNLPNANFEEGSKFLEFRENCGNISKVEELINDFQNEYSSLAQSGQTEAPNAGDDINLHFITIIKKGKKVFELDGRRNGPILLAESNEDNSDVLIEDVVAQRFQKYIDLTDEENKLNFSVIALAPSFD